MAKPDVYGEFGSLVPQGNDFGEFGSLVPSKPAYRGMAELKDTGRLPDVKTGAYKYGGKPGSKEGTDCSGGMCVIGASLGVTLPRTAKAQFEDKRAKSVDPKNLQPGDLVFFNSPGPSGWHVGMYKGNGKFVHQSSDKKPDLSEGDLASHIKKYGFKGAKRYEDLAAKILGGTHVGNQPIAKPPPPKPQPQTLPQVVAKMPEWEAAKRAQDARYYQENFPPVGRETGIANEQQIEAEIRSKGRENLTNPYQKVTEMVGRPLQSAIGKHIRNVSLGTSPISRLMDVLMPGATQEEKDEAVGTWIGVPENVDQAAIMAAIPVVGKGAGFGMRWLDDLVKAAETKADNAIKALGATDMLEQLAPKSDLPIFIPKEDPNYPATMQGIDPLGLAKLGEKPFPPPEVVPAPKPAPAKPVAPKRVSAAPPKPPVETPKPPSKIKTALEGASQERQSAYEAMLAAQKRQSEALKAAKTPSKKAGGVKGRQILPEEVEYFKAWVKEKGWQAASSVEDFVKHMVELGDEAVHWRRIATANAPIKREGQAAQNASTSALRSKIAREPFPNVDKQTMAGWMAEARAKGHNTKAGADKLITLHATGNKPTFSAPETMGLASRLDELDKQFNRAKSTLDNTIGTSREDAAFATVDRISNEIDTITNALNKSGTQQGRDFVARRGMVKDRSFVGLYSEYRKAVERKLTPTETASLQDLAKKFKQVETESTAAAKKKALEKAQELDKIARGELSAVFQKRRRSPVSDAEFKIRSRAIASDAMKAFQTHLAKMKGSMLGGDILPEVAELAKDLAPHIKAYSQLLYDHGVTKVQDNLAEVARFLKANKIEGIEENEVAAVITGRIREQSEKKALTAWEAFTQEVGNLFKAGKSELDEQRRFIEAKAKEAKKAAREQIREADKAKIREEYEQVVAEEKARKEYEKAFWQEVKWWQAGFDEKKLKAARLDREEAKHRWMASAAGRRAQILNRIDTLEKRMEIFKQSGIVQGQKSRLIPAVDPLAREITIKETALKNRWHKIVNDAKREAEAAKLKKESGPWAYWLRAAYSGHRELIATFDDSFPFNQGGMALFSDPGSWAKGFKKSLKSFSEKGYQEVQNEIAQHPRFQQAEAANLFEGGLEDVFGQGRISQQPWFKSFEQAYDGGGAALRLDLFDRWATMMESAGRPLDVTDLTKLADEVKTWTGLGNWGKNQKGIGKMFFALRYRLSQLEILTGQPLFRSVNHWRKTGNPALMKVMLRRYARGIGTMATTVLAANKALAEWGPENTRVELDTTATNFGRLIVNGRATIQVLPPVTRLYLLASRLAGGRYVTEAGMIKDTSDFGDRSRRDLFVDYTASGLHPWFNYIWKWVNAADTEDKKFFDEAFDGSVEQYEDIAKQLFPISVQQSLHLAFDDDMTPAEKILGAMLNFFVPISPIREPQGGKSRKTSAPGAAPSQKKKMPGSAIR